MSLYAGEKTIANAYWGAERVKYIYQGTGKVFAASDIIATDEDDTDFTGSSYASASFLNGKVKPWIYNRLIFNVAATISEPLKGDVGVEIAFDVRLSTGTPQTFQAESMVLPAGAESFTGSLVVPVDDITVDTSLSKTLTFSAGFGISAPDDAGLTWYITTELIAEY